MKILVPIAFIAGIIFTVILTFVALFLLNTITIQATFFLNLAMILWKIIHKKTHKNFVPVPVILSPQPLQHSYVHQYHLPYNYYNLHQIPDNHLEKDEGILHRFWNFFTSSSHYSPTHQMFDE